MTKYGFATQDAQKFPPYLMYDIINVCNAQCSHCPQSSVVRADGYKPLMISEEIFQKTLREAVRHGVEVVRITGDGEPLLHPKLPDFVRLARELGVPIVNLTTNGSLLKGNLLDALLESPPHVFDISLDAFYEKTYAEVRKGLPFDTVKNNVETLLRRRDPALSKVFVSMIRRPGSDEEVAAFQEYWSHKVDFVAIREMHTNLGASGTRRAPDQIDRWPCQHLWQRLVVDYRGLIRYCPVDWDGRSAIAAAASDSLYDVWHGEKLASLRQRHLDKKFADCSVCGQCMDWLVAPWDKGWLKLLKENAFPVESVNKNNNNQ